MIIYNTIVGLAAGAGLIVLSRLLFKLAKKQKVHAEGFALAFGMTGFILTLLGTTISVMWPYTAVLHANIMFGEPALAFGVVLLAAAFFLWRKKEVFEDLGGEGDKSQRALTYIVAVARPVAVWVFAVGLMMLFLTWAILQYKLGAAPPEEPISGKFADYPWVEASFLAFLWGVTGLGAVLFPIALRRWNAGLVKFVAGSWWVTGVLFLLFSAMNYYTHIGLFMNTSDSF